MFNFYKDNDIYCSKHCFYFQPIKIYILYMHFSLLLITIFITIKAQILPIPNTKSLFTIKKIIMTNSPINLNFTFPQEYSNPTFTYSIQKAYFQDKQFTVKRKSHQLTNTQIQVQYQFFDAINFLNFQLTIATIVSNMELAYMSIQQISTPTLFQSYYIPLAKNYQNTLQYTYKISMFTHTIPINYTYYMQNPSSIYLTVIQVETGTNLLSLGMIIIQRNIKKDYALVLYEKFWDRSGSYQQQTGQWFQAISEESAFPGFKTISFRDVLAAERLLSFNMSFQFTFNFIQNNVSYIYITFKGRPQSNNLRSQYSVLLINDTFCCPSNSYLSYIEPFYAIAPSSGFCSPCDSTCGNCTSLPLDPQNTDSFHCLSCIGLRYFQAINSNQGKCSCISSLQQDPITKECKPCTFNCLTFYVKLMSATQYSKFILVFNIPDIFFAMDIADNLKVHINDNNINYSIEEMRNGFFQIQVIPKDIAPCQTKCVVLFTFDYPELVTANNATLSTKSQSLQITDFYVLDQSLSNDINQAFIVVSIFMFVSASAGQISLIKILFDLEQTIQFHKYLQFQIPLVFKQFVQALSAFKFLDLTIIIPVDIMSFFQNLTPNDLDNVGTYKSIYYQYGCNFFKNIFPVVLSVIAIWLINLIAFIILRIIPCQLSHKFAQKIWLRKYITLHDTFQTAMIPVIVFGSWQTLNMPQIKYWWTYALSYIFNLTMLLVPFLAVLYIYGNRKDPETEQINEDLLQDCKLHLKTSYVFYLYTLYKKILFAFLISIPIPGLIQILLIIFTNIVYFISIIHIARYNIYNSKFKLTIRGINSVSLIGIQALILVVNLFPLSVVTQSKIGLACTYMAIAATVAGVIEMLAKIAQTIFQKVKDQAKQGFFFKNKDTNQPDPDFVNKIVKCNLDQLGEIRLHAQPSSYQQAENNPFRKSNLTFGSELVFLQDESQNGNNDLSNTKLDHDSQLVFIQDDDQQVDPIENNTKNNSIYQKKLQPRKKRKFRIDPELRVSNNIIVRPTSNRRLQQPEQLSVVESQTSRIDFDQYQRKNQKN